MKAERSGRRGGRNEPARSAYLEARNPGTAEETHSAYFLFFLFFFTKVRRFGAEGESKGHELEFNFADLFICDLLNISSQTTEVKEMG